MPTSPATPLTLHFSTEVASTLTTARKLYINSGNPTTTSVKTTIATGINWGEITPSASTLWASASVLPPPTGHGCLLDSVLLEGSTLVSGPWSAKIRLSETPNTTTFGVDMRMRVYRRTSGGVYTPIVIMPLSALFSNGWTTTYIFPSTAGDAVSFATGDKLYVDLWAIAGPNPLPQQPAAFTWYALSTDTVTMTGAANATLTSPGYTGTQTSTTRNTAARLRLLARTTPNIAARLLLQTGTTLYRQIASRVRVLSAIKRDVQTRLNLIFTAPGTPITLYGTRLQARTSANANELSANVTNLMLATNMQLGTSLGTSEILSQGTSRSWASAATVGNPTGSGWFFESPLLWNQQVLSGTWSPSITLQTSKGSILADITLRVYVYSIFGSYVPVISSTLIGQTIGSSASSFLIGSVGRNELTIYGGEYLYVDAWLSVTQTLGTDARTLLTSTVGGESISTPVGGFTLAMPNYRLLPGGDVMARFALQLLTVVYDTAARLLLATPPQNDIYTRLFLLFKPTGDIAVRLFLRLLTVANDIAARLFLISPPMLDLSLRVIVQLLTSVKDVAARIRLTLAQVHDVLTRLQLLALSLQDIKQRLVLHSTPIRNLASRFPAAAVQDTFVRANQSGFGTTADGDTWNQTGGYTLAISSNHGTVTGATTVSTITIGSKTFSDVEILARVSSSSNSDSVGVMARRTGSSTNYFARLSASSVFVVGKNIAGTPTVLQSVTFTWSASTDYWIRLRVIGTVLQAKVWASGSAEPAAWTAQTNDSSITSAGLVGIRTSLNVATNTAKYDSFVATDAVAIRTLTDTTTRLLLQ